MTRGTRFGLGGLASVALVGVVSDGPDAAYTLDDLAASITAASLDPDGDAITYRRSPAREGVASSESSTVVALNTPPVVTDLSFAPSSTFANDMLITTTRTAVGFGEALGLNTGAVGAGENYLWILVR